MKNKILIISLGLGMNLFALDINEAVDIALKNNYSLKQQQYIVDESKVKLDSSKSTYLPKLDLNYNYNSRDKLISSQSQIDEDSNLNITLSYNLFNGFSDKYDIKSAQSSVNYSKFVFRSFKADFILNVKNIYIGYLSKQKNTQTLYEALKLYEKQYFDSQNYFNQGLIAQNELLEVEVEMLQAKQNYQKAKNEQKIAKKQLKNIMSGELKQNENIDELTKNTFILSDFKEKNLANRSELKALEQLIFKYQNSKESQEGNFYPKIDAKLSYNKYGEDLTPTNRASYPDSQSIGTLNLKWNLYNGKKDNLSMLIYNKKIKQIKMQKKDLQLQIKLQYEEALEELTVSKLNLKTAIKAKEQAKRNYEIVKDKVKEGISSNSDLINANYLLTKSKQNYFTAFYSEYLAIAILKRVTTY